MDWSSFLIGFGVGFFVASFGWIAIVALIGIGAD